MATVFGMSLVLTLCLTGFAIVLRQVRILIPMLSVAILLAFSGLGLAQSPPMISSPSLLFASMVLGLVGYLIYWPAMLRRLSDHLLQWLTLLGLLLLILLNQVWLNSLWIFCLPAFVLSAVVLVQFIQQFREYQSKNRDLLAQLDAKSIAIGLDLATGLPNKLAFTDRIDKWLLINPEQQLNVIVFKFTQFALLNSVIGHQNADVVKVQLITRLRNALSKNKGILLLSDSIDTAFLATLGGVDFTLAIHDNDDNFATEKLINQLKEEVKEPILVNATAVDVGVEFGVATYPQQGLNADDLIEHAYIALNHHRETGSTIYFNSKLQKRLQTNRAVIGQLREDLNHNKFELFVQPQVNLITRKVDGGEVLIRWRRDEMGVLEASKFIELAEESGVIYQLSLWCLEQTLIKLKQLQAMSLDQFLAVNISNRELFQSQFVETLSQLLDKHEVDPAGLVFEIKESAFALNQDKALKVTRLIQQLGVKVALDEFGKDHSAMSCFNRFTPCYVKVDCRSLNAQKKGDKTNTYLNAIIGMAQTLHIPTIAHGIELDSTLSQLRDIKCEGGQGYLFSKPFELSGFEIWLEQWQRQQVSQYTPDAEIKS